MPPIYVCNKQNWSPIFRIFGAAINLIFNLMLIPIYGMMGAAIATAISYGLMFMWLFYKNRIWMPIKLAWDDIILLGAMTSTSVMCFILVLDLRFYVMAVTGLYVGFLLYKHGIKNLILLFK